MWLPDAEHFFPFQTFFPQINIVKLIKLWLFDITADYRKTSLSDRQTIAKE